MNEEKLAVVAKIADAFLPESIVWGIGASMLLWQIGAVDHFRDIDIIVRLQDAQQADDALCRLGTKTAQGSTGIYTTAYFCSYEIDAVSVDLMGRFGMHHDSACYSFDFGESDIAFYANILERQVPFTALEDWYVLYSMMRDREEKVLSIERHFAKNGITDAARFQSILKQRQLPDSLRDNIRRLLKTFSREWPSRRA